MANQQILASYSPESVVVVISNSKMQHTISGFTDGTFLELTRVVPHATLYTGADATNARVTRRVRNFDITLTLHQASESNDVLSQLLLLDEESRNLDDIFAITIKDTSGRTVASSPSAFIGTPPDQSFGVEISDRAWVLHAVGMDIFIGGNGKFTADTFSTLTDLGVTIDPYWNPNTVA
jgi:hypothetical protein